ncbi:hypothetical protein BUN20_22015 [Bacteroides fragilis]|nr:hypothetical protein BUN20_22015 [Bacteroides fragilis]
MFFPLGAFVYVLLWVVIAFCHQVLDGHVMLFIRVRIKIALARFLPRFHSDGHTFQSLLCYLLIVNIRFSKLKTLQGMKKKQKRMNKVCVFFFSEMKCPLM